MRKSLVLLKNGKGSKPFLPLSKTAKKILVAGYHANDIGRQCGGWTITWQGGNGTITKGINQFTHLSTQIPIVPSLKGNRNEMKSILKSGIEKAYGTKRTSSWWQKGSFFKGTECSGLLELVAKINLMVQLEERPEIA